MPKKKRIGYKRHSIGVVVNEQELFEMRKQLKSLKNKTNYTRNDIIKVICTKLLSDDEFIQFCEIKGNLSK